MKYRTYESNLRAAIETKLGPEAKFEVAVNPGPGVYNMNFEQSKFDPCMYTLTTRDSNTNKLIRGSMFRYPRIGAFEITVTKGTKRITVFSKLKTRKWPACEQIIERLEQTVLTNLGGWEPAEEVPKDEKKRYSTAKMSDDDLRGHIKKKFHHICAAFRAFDKNGDGKISKGEFLRGLKESGIDLPPAQMMRLWEMADEDGSGTLIYGEFTRKFSTYKATSSLHKHSDLADENQKTIYKLHGSGSVSRIQKQAAIRVGEKHLSWGVEGEELAAEPDPEKRPESIAQLARRKDILAMPLNECSNDMIRAKIYNRYGNLVNAWRHFDKDGSGTIGYDEFLRELPKVLSEPISKSKFNELWQFFDPDMSGYVDMNEFMNPNLQDDSKGSLALAKGTAVDHTYGGGDGDDVIEETRYSSLGKTDRKSQRMLGVEQQNSKKQLTEDPSLSTMATTGDLTGADDIHSGFNSADDLSRGATPFPAEDLGSLAGEPLSAVQEESRQTDGCETDGE